MLQLKVNGVYNQNVLELLRSEDITKFSFDLRPRSFNFIQLHKIEELLVNYGDLSPYLLFEEQQPFIFQEIYLLLNKYQPTIQFTQNVSIDLIHQIDLPFIYPFNKDSLSEILLHQKCQGWTVSSELLAHEMNTGTINHFIEQLGEKLSFRKNIPTFELSLEMNWDRPLMSSLLHLIPFNILEYSVNNLVEDSYRQLNNQKILQYLNFIKKNHLGLL